MKKLLVILLMSAATCLAECKIVYFIPPTGYIASYEKILNSQTYKEDDFCRAMYSLREQLQNRGYQLLPTKFDKKLEHFQGLLASDLSEKQTKKIKKYSKSKLIFVDINQSNKSVARYFGKNVTLDNFVDNVLGALGIQKQEPVAVAENAVSEVDVVEPLILSIIIGPSSIKPGQSALLNVVTDGGVEPLTFSWSDGQTGEDLNSILVSPTQDTEYTVTVRDSSNPPVELTSLPMLLRIASEKSEEVEEKIEAREEREVAQDFAASIEGKSDYKAHDIIQLKAFPDGARYTWSGPEGFASTMQKISRRATPSSAGTYTVKVEKDGATQVANIEIKVEEVTYQEPQIPVVELKPAAVAHVEVSKAPVQDASKSELLVVRTRNFVRKDTFVNFNVVVQNAGNGVAKRITLSDVIPSCFELVEVQGEGWNINQSRDGFIANLDSLAAGKSKSLNVTVRLVFEPKDRAYNKAVVTSASGIERESLAVLA